MARHVDPDDTSFRRSLLRAAAAGVAALALTFGITALLTRTGQIGEGDGPAMIMTTPPSDAPTVVAAAPPTEPTPEPTRAPEPAPTQLPPATSSPAPTEVAQTPVAGVTVQVLEQVGAEAQAAEAAEVLRRLGYDVVAVNVTDRQVDTTTVLASAGRTADAEQLKARDPRFGVVADNDGFSPDVDLHVIVGADFSA